MTDQDSLRDRIASALEMADAEASDGGFAIAMPDHAAQAIIDELGLTVEERLTEFGIDDPGYQQRVVGKWEER